MNFDEIDAELLQIVHCVSSFIRIGGHEAVRHSRLNAIDKRTGAKNPRAGESSAVYFTPQPVDHYKIAAHLPDAGNSICDVQAGFQIARAAHVDMHVPESRNQEFFTAILDHGIGRQPGCSGRRNANDATC